MERYIKLLDKMNYNSIIKLEGRKQFEYVYGKKERWERTGIMLEYYGEQSDKYEKYAEISQGEAIEIINAQRIMYNKLYQYIVDIIKDYKVCRKNLMQFVMDEDGFGNICTDIVALLFSMGDRNSINKELLEMLTPSIANSLDILYRNIDMVNEQQLIQLRINESANEIVLLQIKEAYSSNVINEEKFNILLNYFSNKIVFLDEKQKQVIFNIEM